MADDVHGAGGSGREVSALLQLALPITLGQWTQMAMHTIDTAMVGRLGVESVAASSLGSIVTAPFFFGIGAVGAALPPLVAQALGRGDRLAAARWLRHGRACAIVLSVLSALVFVGLVRWLPANGQPETVVAGAQRYGLIVIWSLIPVMLLQNWRGWAEAHGRPWLPMGNIALGLLVNTGANAVLIYGWGPVPQLGLAGAAMGTCLARVVMWLHFRGVIRRHEELTPVAVGAETGPWSRELLGRYLKFGGLTAVATLLVIGSGIGLVFWVARLGPVVLAAHEIGRQMWLIGYIIPFGWSMAVALRCAYWWGRRDEEGLRHCATISLRTGGLIGLALGALYWGGRDWWPLLFLGADQAGSETAVLASQTLKFAAVVMVCEGGFLAAVGVCRGLTRMSPVAIAYLASYWLLGLGGAYWLGSVKAGGLLGYWTGFTGGVVFGTVGLIIYTLNLLRRSPEARI